MASAEESQGAQRISWIMSILPHICAGLFVHCCTSEQASEERSTVSLDRRMSGVVFGTQEGTNAAASLSVAE